MRVSEHTVLLEIESDKGRYYPVIIHDGENTILVDTGFPMQVELIRTAMEREGFRLDEITGVIFTHQDIDHIGCAEEIISLSNEVKTMAHEAEAPYINGTLTPVKLENMDESNPFHRQLKAWFDSRKITIDILLTDGEILPVCGGIEIIHTPGHTPGHICLYMQNDKVLIAGDALNIKNGTLTGADPLYTKDMEQANESIQKLSGYDMDQVITYHGGLYVGSVRDV